MEGATGHGIGSSSSSGESQSSVQDTAAGLSEQQQQKNTQWMENKSQVLDEVDQLVDLMSDEKESLSKKITELEEKLELMGKKGSTLEEDNRQLRSDYDTAKRELEELQEKHLKERSGLKEALAATRKELKEVEKKLESLTYDLVTEQEKGVKTSSAQADLKQRLKCLQGEHRSLGAALELQCRENVKTSEQCKSLTAENSLLQTKLETTQQKSRHSQEEVLALKGRLTHSRKLHDQLRQKNSELDRALNEATAAKSPTVIKVTSRSKEEIRLLTECKRKDGLIANFTEELSTANKTKLKLQDQMRRLEQKLKREEKEKLLLENTLEEKRLEWASERSSLQDKLHQSTTKLQAREAKEEESCSGRERLQTRLCQIEEELTASRRELSTLREELKESNETSEKEKVHLEQEREKSKCLHQVKQRTISQLRTELDVIKLEHTKLVEDLNEKWESRLGEAKEDYRRLVEVSTKRCTELAREVWQLKAQLQEAGCSLKDNKTTSTDGHVTPHNSSSTQI